MRGLIRRVCPRSTIVAFRSAKERPLAERKTPISVYSDRLLVAVLVLLLGGLPVEGQESQAPKSVMRSHLEIDWIEPSRQLANLELRGRFIKVVKSLRSDEPGSVDYSRSIEELQLVLAAEADCFVTSMRRLREREPKSVPEPRAFQPGMEPRAFRIRNGAVNPMDEGAVVSPALVTGSVPLSDVIERILSELPDKGREFYELKFGSEASAGLKQALEEGSIKQLATVTRKFVLTQAGNEAAYRLGTFYLESGRTLEALRLFNRVLLLPASAVKLEPALSLKRSTALLRLGRTDEAKLVLDQLRKTASSNVAMKWPADWDKQLDDRLQRIATSGVREPEKLLQWTHFLGDAARTALPASVGAADVGVWEQNTFYSGTAPTAEQLKKYRYAPPKSGKDNEEEFAPPAPQSESDMAAAMAVGHDWIVSAERDNREVALPSNYPLIVDGKAVFRTLSRVKAVDLRTGRSVWETAAPDPAYADLFVPGARWRYLDSGVDRINLFSPLTKWHQSLIEARTRSDRSIGTLSSDGQRVFFLDACGVTHPGGAPGIRGTKGNTPNVWNRLCAVDLATGKAIWEIGAPLSAEEPTTGEFVLGAPTVIDGRLYAIAESKDDVRLLCLDPMDGRVMWTETICRLVDGQSVLSEGLRRVAADSPTFCQGWLVCPTTCGFLMAYDLAGRRWGWCYGYESASLPPDHQFRNPAARFNSGPRMKYDALRSDDRWTEGSIFSDGTRVVFSAIDSDELHCLDVLTGALVWAVPRQTGHYVAGLFEGQVIVVDRDRVRALALESGEVTWTLSLENRRAAGRGLRNGASYLLPVAELPTAGNPGEALSIQWDSRIITIDLKTGTVTSQSARSTTAPLGNLVAGSGFLLAQSYDKVVSFPPLGEVESLLQQQLASDPKNAAALARRGRLRLQQQREDEGLADLTAALNLKPSDDVRQTLIDLSLDRLRAGKTTSTELRALFAKIQAPDEVLRKVLRSEVYSLRGNGQFVEAFQKTLELLNSASTSGAQPTDVIGDVSRFRRRGPAALLATIYRQAAADASGGAARKALDQLVGEQFASAAKTAGPRDLLKFVDAFGWHPKSLEARWEIASSNRLDAKQDFLKREQQALFLSRQADPQIAAPAALVLLALWIEAGSSAANVSAVEQFARRFSGQKLNDGSLIDDKFRELLGDAAFKKLHPKVEWLGPVKVEKSVATKLAPTRDFVPMLGPISPAFRDGTIEIETLGRDDRAQRRMVARDALGFERWQIPIGFEVDAVLGAGPIANLSQGHLIAASSAGRLTVLDVSAPTFPKPLWTRDVIDFDAAYGRHGSELLPVAGVYPKRPVSRWQLPIAVRHQRNEFTGSVDALTSECVVYRTDNRLTVADSLTGQVLWIRNNVKSSSRVLADDEFLVVHHSNQADVLRLFDGDLVTSVSSPLFEDHLTSAGRDLVLWEDAEKQNVLSRVDALTGKTVWRHVFPGSAVLQVVDHETVAVLQATGEFQMFDIWTGQPFVTAKLPPEPLLKSVFVLPGPDGHLVMTDISLAVRSVERRQIPTPNAEFNQVRGHVSRVSSSGEVAWSADLPLQRYLVGQPRELPLLIFRREAFVRVADQEGGAQRTNNLLIFDKQTGKLLLDEQPERSDDTTTIEARVDDREVQLQFERLGLSFQFQGQ